MKTIENKFTAKIHIGEYHGDMVFLAPPSWDCGWYWGFGYIQNRNMHTHYDCLCLTKVERYNSNESVWELTDFCHTLADNPDFTTTLSKVVQWKLSDYMKSFYTLQKTAEVTGRGSSNYSGDINKTVQNKSISRKINNVLLPKLFNEIAKLLGENRRP